MDNNDSKPQQTGGLKLMTVFIAVLALHVLVIGGFTVYHLMGSGGDADLTLDKNHKLKADGTVVTDTATPDASAPDKTADSVASTDTATTPSTPAATGTTTAATPTTDANPAPTDTATPAAAPAPAANPSPAPAAPTQVAATTSATTTPATPASATGSSPIVLSGDDMGQTSTVPPGLAPPADQPNPDNISIANSPASAPAPSSTVTAPAPAPAVPEIVPVTTPSPAVLSSTAPSGPIAPQGVVAPGPVHMPPANLNGPAPAPVVATHEEHVSAPSHEEHSLASTHETKKAYYTVKMTDTFKKIAETHHITVAELKSANHIKPNTLLKTGQKLVIPMSKTSIARNGASHEDESTASLSASPVSEKPHHHYYTVTKGDTLKYIARKFNVTPSAIERANDLSGSKLAVGEKLRIPTHESHNTATASTASVPLTDQVAAPVVAAPAPVEPSQVVAQPAPIEQPAPTPVASPAPEPQQPTPTPASSPELTSLNF